MLMATSSGIFWYKIKISCHGLPIFINPPGDIKIIISISLTFFWHWPKFCCMAFHYTLPSRLKSISQPKSSEYVEGTGCCKKDCAFFEKVSYLDM